MVKPLPLPGFSSSWEAVSWLLWGPGFCRRGQVALSYSHPLSVGFITLERREQSVGSLLPHCPQVVCRFLRWERVLSFCDSGHHLG